MNKVDVIDSERIVKRVFFILGVDIDDPESVASFQDDLRFNRKLNNSTTSEDLVFLRSLRGNFNKMIGIITSLMVTTIITNFLMYYK